MGPRHAQPADPAAAASEHVAHPVPCRRDIPDSQTGISDDVNDTAEDDGRPAGSAQHGVGGPGIDERTDDLHRIGGGWVRIDLCDGVFWVLGVFEVLCEERLGAHGTGVVEEDVQRHQGPDVPRGENFPQLGSSVWRTLGTALKLHAFFGEFALGGCEVPCSAYLGDVWEDEEACDGDREGDDAVYKEEPLPAFHPAAAPEMIDPGHKIARKHTGDGGAGVEDAGALGELVASIPGTDQILHARVERAFCEADEESQGVELTCCIAAGKAKGENGPDKFHGWNPD